MTEEADRDLVKRAEAALSSLPFREPDWDGLAARVEGAVKSAPPENADLFEAPLPAGAEDGTEHGPAISVGPESTEEVDDAWASAPEAASPAAATAESGAILSAAPAAPVAEEPEEIEAASEPAAADEPPPSPREGVSLADLARASVARRGSSEAASIAKESLAVATRSRAQGEQIAERMQAARTQPSVPPPAPSSRQAPQPARKSESGDVLRGPWVGIVIGGIGLAAGFGLYLRSQNSDTQPIAVEQREQPRALEPQAAPVAKTETPRARAVDPEPEAKLEPSTLESLGRAPAPRAESKPGVAKPESGGAVPTPAPAAGGSGKVVAEKIVLDEDKPAPKPAPITGGAHPGDSKLRPAELSSSSAMTDRPSAGAAQAAVGAVLGAARACVAGHPQPSSAQIVFGSDGQVQSVSVGGPAAGTPAGACIESALKKARVQPFAASSFSLGVTVRPQ